MNGSVITSKSILRFENLVNQEVGKTLLDGVEAVRLFENLVNQEVGKTKDLAERCLP